MQKQRSLKNAISAKVVNMSPISTWNSGACTYTHTADQLQVGMPVLFVVNSVKLHLTAFNLVEKKWQKYEVGQLSLCWPLLAIV